MKKIFFLLALLSLSSCFYPSKEEMQKLKEHDDALNKTITDFNSSYKDNNCNEIEYLFSNSDFLNKKQFENAITCATILQKVRVLYQELTPNTTILTGDTELMYYASDNIYSISNRVLQGKLSINNANKRLSYAYKESKKTRDSVNEDRQQRALQMEYYHQQMNDLVQKSVQPTFQKYHY